MASPITFCISDLSQGRVDCCSYLSGHLITDIYRTISVLSQRLFFLPFRERELVSEQVRSLLKMTGIKMSRIFLETFFFFCSEVTLYHFVFRDLPDPTLNVSKKKFHSRDRRHSMNFWLYLYEILYA